MIGKTVSHYKITRELGAGGMGVVYEAVDTKLDRTVALKFLPPESTRDPEAKARFIHEAKAASAIDHPYVCNIYEIDETEDGKLFLAMARYEGETLKERIAKGPLSIDETLNIAQQTAQGLAKAHEEKIVHRDIKPANIFITSDGLVKILDFGVAKLTNRTMLTKTGTTLGTAGYMSPEQAKGEEVDHRSDIFSLGAILYEMLVGEPPFKGGHEAALLYGIVHMEPESLPEEILIGNPGLQGVVDKALSKEKASRYQQVQELETDLLQLSSNLGQVPAASDRNASTTKGISRKRGLTYFGLVAFAAIFLYVTLLLVPSDQTRFNRKSIAVLPFKNIVTEQGYEWVGEGMREAILGHLTKIKDLKVISNASADLFRDTDLTIAEIAEKLGVATILEASVQQTDGRMHLMIKLIDARADNYIWAEDYNRDLKDVFAVQSDVAMKVAEKLNATLFADVEERIEVRPTDNIEAYKMLMNSRDQWSKGTHDDRMESLRTAEQVIKIDPNYSDAYAWLSNRHILITFYGYQPPKEMYPKANEYALKALELDESNIAALNALAMSKTYFERDLKEAERLFKRIIELNPGESRGHSGLGWLYMFMGRFDEAISEYRLALDLNPLAVGLHQNMGELLYFSRRYDESIEASLRAIDMNPDYPQSHMFLGAAYQAKGMNKEALAALDKEQELSRGNRPETENWIGMYFAIAGEAAKARAVLDNLHETSRELWVSPVVIANIHMALGEVDRGFQWLEKGYQESDSRLLYILVHSAYDSVRTDPRYIKILEKADLLF